MKLSLDELEMYVFLLNEAHQEVFTDYKEIKALLKDEFDINTTEKEISLALEPRAEDEEEDLRVLLKEFYE